MNGQFAVMKTQDHDIGHVQEVVQQAHAELQHLLQQRAEVTRKIGTVKQTISGLANLFGDSVLSDDLLELVDRKTSRRQPGFTKICRRILMNANRSLSSREVCERISNCLGYDCVEPLGSLRGSQSRNFRQWPSRVAMGFRSGSHNQHKRVKEHHYIRVEY
jgi:hypothetical protein